MEDAMMLGKGATKKMPITHNGLQLLYNAHDNKINRKPDARNADKNMILFNGFILLGWKVCSVDVKRYVKF